MGVRSDLYPRDPAHVRVTEFFGSVRNVERTDHVVELETGPTDQPTRSVIGERTW